MGTLEDSPVLALEHNIIAAFESFHANVAGLVARGVVDGDVLLDLDAAPPRTPRVDRAAIEENAQIRVHVVLFELLWAFIYSWTVIYEETVQKAQLRGAEVGETTAENEQLVSRAYELWSWAKSLREGYMRWPKNLPSPRHQCSESETWYALKANLIFQQAASFLLSHELAHMTQGHLDISRVDANADALSMQLENEADQRAFDKVVGQGLEDKEKSDKAWAIFSVMLSSMFTLPEARLALVSHGHPPLHHRLGHLVRSLGFEGEGYRHYFPLLARVVLQDAFPELARPGQHYEDAEEAFHAALDDLDRLASTGSV